MCIKADKTTLVDHKQKMRQKLPALIIKQLYKENCRHQDVIAKLNNEINLLLSKLSERDKVRTLFNRLNFCSS